MKRFDSISTILFVIAAFIAILLGYSFYVFSKYENYTSTDGSVLVNQSANMGRISGGKMPLFSLPGATINYEYSVNGKKYLGASHEILESKLQEQEWIQVYYDPSEPENSVLNLKFDAGYFFVLVLFLILILVAEYLWYKFRYHYLVTIKDNSIPYRKKDKKN